MGGLPEVTSPNSARQHQPLLLVLHSPVCFPTKIILLFLLQLPILSKLPLPIYKAPFLGVLAICPPNVLSLDNVALFLPDTGPMLCSATLK